jgi:hypothetical protein
MVSSILDLGREHLTNDLNTLMKAQNRSLRSLGEKSAVCILGLTGFRQRWDARINELCRVKNPLRRK